MQSTSKLKEKQMKTGYTRVLTFSNTNTKKPREQEKKL